MKKGKKLLKYLIPIAIVVYAGYRLTEMDKEQDEMLGVLEESYSKIHFKDRLNNIVDKTYYPSDWRGEEYFQYVTFKNGKKVSIDINKALCNDSVYFNQLLQKGTLLKKNEASDTLYVYNKDMLHLFLLNMK
ncbi:MAG: hypothetical protein ACOCWG_04595 [bacterium]